MMKRIIAKMMNWIMLSCEEATLLMTKKQLGNFPLLKSMQLRLHLMSCKLCRRFKIQNETIQKFWKEFDNTDHVLTGEKKEELDHIIQDHNQ
jgi:hypothetical protein